MKKFALAIFILLFGLFFAPNKYIVSAEETQGETNNSPIVNTIYTDGILEYKNLTNISKLAINDTYIAYSLDKNNIEILNKESKSTVKITNFGNIHKIKFVGEKLLVVTDTNIKVIDVFKDFAASNYSSIPDISFTNLRAIDIYSTNSLIYIGFVDGQTFNLNEYSLTLQPKNNPIKQITSNRYSDTYVMAINDKTAYIVSNELSPTMYALDYLEDEPTTSPLSIPYKVLDTFYYNGNEYILSFTTENLSLLTPDFTEIDTLTINPIENVALDITDIEFYESKIVVADKRNTGAIQVYNINLEETNNELSSTEILVCSNSKNIGRYNNAEGIVVSGDTIMVADTNNNNIHIIENGTTTYINDLNTSAKPRNLAMDEKLNIFFIEDSTSNSIVTKYRYTSAGYVFATKYETVSSNNIGYVSSLIAHNSTVYLLDYTNNNLLAITNNGMQIKAGLSIDLNENSMIEYIKGTNQLVIYNDATLYLLNTSGTILNSITTEELVSITADLYHIYGLQNDTIHIYSINTTDNTIIKTTDTVTCDDFVNLSEIEFCISAREIFAYDSSRACLVRFTFDKVNNPFNFEDYSTTEPLLENSTILPIAITNNPIIYEYPYHIGKAYNKDYSITNCIGIGEYANEYRILFNHNGELTSGFISKTNAQIQTITSETNEVIAINQKIPVYKYPTILTHNDDTIRVGVVEHKTVFTVTAKFPISIDGKVFYQYKYDGKVGYIFNADIVLNDDRSISYITTKNATIKAIGVDTIELYSEDKTEVVTTLKNDDRIYVAEYNENNEYTKVIYTDSSLNTIEGYVKTEYIEMDKLDNMRIILIVVIIISVILLIVIIASYIAIKKKKS